MYLREGLEILLNSECHAGAVCRTAFSLATLLGKKGRSKEAEGYRELGIAKKSEIADSGGLGFEAEEYECFIPVAHRAFHG